jgi:hypothetical protein
MYVMYIQPFSSALILAIGWAWFVGKIHVEWLQGSRAYTTTWGRVLNGLLIPLIQLTVGLSWVGYLTYSVLYADGLSAWGLYALIAAMIISIGYTTVRGIERVILLATSPAEPLPFLDNL